MENTKQKNILYLIAMLLVINLLGTLWLVKQVAIQPTKLASKSTDQESLPDYLTKETRKEIYMKFEEAYNSQDSDSFWNLFSNLAKAQMNKNDLKIGYERLLDIFGRLSNGIFAYYDFIGSQGNLRTFDLHYGIEITGSKGKKGEVKITITDDGKEYGIVGVHISFM